MVFLDPFGFALLTPEEGQEIVTETREWTGTPWEYGGNSCSGIDCSHFVNTAYDEAGYPYEYTETGGDWEKAGFEEVEKEQAQPGDIILWDGHVGIVVDPGEKTFTGAQTSTGVAEASYGEGSYWDGEGNYGGPNKGYKIYRFDKPEGCGGK